MTPPSLPPPLPPSAPSIKLTIETLADLFGLKVCSHGDLGIRFGAGPVLASEETTRIIRAAIEGLCAQESAQVDEMRAALRQICEGEGRGSGWSPEMALGRVARLQAFAEEMKQQRNASLGRREYPVKRAWYLPPGVTLKREDFEVGSAEYETHFTWRGVEGPLEGLTDDETTMEACLQSAWKAWSWYASETPEEAADRLIKPADATPTVRIVGPKLRRGSAGAAGLDLPIPEAVSLRPGETKRLKTGVRVALPPGYEAQVRPRSSASARGLLVYVGTIDADYRGEVEIVVTNLTGEWAHVDKTIAQLVIAEVANLPIEYVDALDDTPRGASGFGSSDKKGGA